MDLQMLIIKYHHIGKGKLQGTFSLQIPKWGNFIIKDMSYFVDGNRKWVNFPSKQFEVNGEKKYMPYNSFEDISTTKNFQDQCIKILEEYLMNNKT